jgi:hypothetical protein
MNFHPEPTVTYLPVIVRPEPPGRFTAEPLGIPELRAVADCADAAVEKVRLALLGWRGSLRWVPVPNTAPSASELEKWAGHAKDDPDHEAYLEAIRRYRQEVDERECLDSSSTPTT